NASIPTLLKQVGPNCATATPRSVWTFGVSRPPGWRFPASRDRLGWPVTPKVQTRSGLSCGAIWAGLYIGNPWYLGGVFFLSRGGHEFLVFSQEDLHHLRVELSAGVAF